MKLAWITVPRAYRRRHKVLKAFLAMESVPRPCMTKERVERKLQAQNLYFPDTVSYLEECGHLTYSWALREGSWNGLHEFRVTGRGRAAATTEQHLTEGYDRRMRVAKFFGEWTALILAAMSIAMNVYQVVKNHQLEDRVDQLEKRIELVASPAPVDSLPMTGR